MSILHSFLQLNNISLYAYAIVYPFVNDVHLSCFHHLAIIDNAALSFHVQVLCIVEFEKNRDS